MPEVNKSSVINDGMLHTRNIILRSMCAAYLIAFASFYHQSAGIFGERGILPARVHIETSASTISAFIKTPTLLHFGFVLGLDTESMIDLICALGMFISCAGMVSIKCCLLPAFATQWILYFSLYQITDTFSHQSDQLLLEAGFVCIILSPFTVNRHSTPIDKIVLVLLKWILFRFLFESGAVKIISRCPKWWALTAMENHFETLPLPTVFAYLVHNLPASILKAFNIFMIASELAVPWLFFFPHRALKQAVFYWQVNYQLSIILTGNYGLQPFLVIILSLTLLDDDFFENQSTFSSMARSSMHILKSVLILNGVLVVGALSLPSFYSPLGISANFLKCLVKIIHTAPALALLVLILTAFGNLLSHPIKAYSRSLMQKLYFVNTTVGFTILAAILLVISMVPLSNLDNSTNISNSNLGEYYETIKKFSIINQYGMHLRKMRSERLEIIYEHAQSAEGPWTEYGFRYKPWSRTEIASFTGLELMNKQYMRLTKNIRPHLNICEFLAGFYLPRLDNKFYDAVSSTFRDNLWTVVLAYRLLENEPQVLKLLGIDEPIQPAPKYVRAVKYKFWITSMDSKAYWVKAIRGEYLPAVSMDNAVLLSQLRSLKISPTSMKAINEHNILTKVLHFLRQQVNGFSGPYFTWIIVFSASLIIFLKYFLANLKNNKNLTLL